MTQENKSGSAEPKQTKSAREIEADIGQTRNALSEDIKALGDKISPANIKHEAKQALNDAKDATVEKAGQLKDAAIEKAAELKDVAVDKAQQAAEVASEAIDDVSREARRAGEALSNFAAGNAVPLALIAIGAGWLFANRGRPRVYSGDDELEDDVIYDARSTRRGPRTNGPKRGALKRAGDNVKEARSRASSKLEAGYEAAGETIEQAEHALARGVNRGRDIVTDSVSRARQATSDFAHENPLAVAFGSLLAGVGVGLLLPTSAGENRLLAPGRARIRRLVGDARETAREVGSAARSTARDTVSALEGRGQ